MSRSTKQIHLSNGEPFMVEITFNLMKVPPPGPERDAVEKAIDTIRAAVEELDQMSASVKALRKTEADPEKMARLRERVEALPGEPDRP